MTDVLVILNPRRIDECVTAISELPIDKLWLRNMSEREIEGCWPEVEDLVGGYDRAIILSDDTVPRRWALEAVQELLDDGHPVATGYCNLALDDMRVNLAARLEDTLSGNFPLFQDVVAARDTAIPTVFAGFCLTGMSTELWAEYPFETEPAGNSSDRQLCRRLAAGGVPIVAARDGFVWHVKERWSQGDTDPRKRLLVGVEPASIDLDKAGVAA